MKRMAPEQYLCRGLNCLPPELLSYVFELSISKLEEVATLSEVCKLFHTCAKRSDVVSNLTLTYASIIRALGIDASIYDKEAARKKLVEVLRLFQSLYPSIGRIELGNLLVDKAIYCENELVQMLPAFSSLKSLSLAGCWTVTDFKPLQSLTALTGLELQHTSILVAGLSDISGSLTALKCLNLNGCESVSGKGFACLSALVSLQELDVSKTFIDDDGLAGLPRSLTALNKLKLTGCSSISAPGFACLSSLTSLHELNVRETDITDNGLEILSGSLTELAILDLCACKSISGQAFACLSSLTSLQDLNLNFTDIVDEGLAGLSRCVALTNLSLYNCRSISGPGFACLSSLASLQYLNLYDTSINARVLGLLKKALQSEIGYDIR